MPSMINSHSYHSLVAVSNKLFVIAFGTNDCEVFDNTCEKFISLKTPSYVTRGKVVSNETKILVIQEETSSIVSYDVYRDEWSVESCEFTNKHRESSYVNLPWYLDTL